MFRSVEIDGYRGLGRFAMRGLGRVNLLVGKNNCGKTSVLEAAYLLATGGTPTAIWRICDLRGERFPENDGPAPTMEADIAHLFLDHEFVPGKRFSITGKNGSVAADFELSIRTELLIEQRRDAHTAAVSTITPSTLPLLQLIIKPGLRRQHGLALSPRGGLGRDEARVADLVPFPTAPQTPRNIHFIPARSLDGASLLIHWNRLLEEGQEGLAIDALRIVDPLIQNVAARAGDGYSDPQTRFIIKRQGETNRVPLGSLGGGIQRMFALSVVLPHCANGMLIIDEIDTGLHHTVMSDMWRLIFEASKRFNVQVFASTHSYDCVESLATICRAEETSDSEVTIQRIEAGRPTAVAYSEDEIRTAAERHIETR